MANFQAFRLNFSSSTNPEIGRSGECDNPTHTFYYWYKKAYIVQKVLLHTRWCISNGFSSVSHYGILKSSSDFGAGQLLNLSIGLEKIHF